MRLSGEEVIALRAGGYRARMAPHAGARLASLTWRDVDLVVPWDGASFDEHAWPKAGAFPMLPFANRLPAQGFRLGERRVQPGAAPNGLVQHGIAHRRPWQVVGVSTDHARLRLEQDADAGWPWAWSAEMEVSLGAAGITVVLRARNDSDSPMPLAMGWHPYHPVRGDVGPRDLHFAAAARHALDAEGKASRSAAEPAFAMLPGETASFSAWTGRANLQSSAEHGIAVACEGAPHLVLHRPASGDYACIEPVTVLPGHLGEDGDGVLQPGQSRQLAWTCGVT